MRPEVVFAEAARLSGDLSGRIGEFDDRARALVAALPPEVTRVYLVGDGDSHHAACATEMAFESIAGVACEPLSALRFLEYGADALRLDGGPTLVVLTSASGATERVLQCAHRARSHGARTVALTGTPDSALVDATDDALVVDVPDRVRSPGVRTYQASLLGMLLLAVRLAGVQNPRRADGLVAELATLAEPIAATDRLVAERATEVADRVAGTPFLTLAGSGPGWGTAWYGAAKLVETAGLFAAAQDTEEWHHVERFALPEDLPLVIVAQPGRAHWRSVLLAEQAAATGRRVFAVADERDDRMARNATAVLPVHGATREEFSPLLYHLFAAHLAGHVAVRLGRAPFRSGAT